MVVTEPTLTAMSDMDRIVQLRRHFGIPTYVLINKPDLNARNAALLRERCAGEGLPIVGEAAFDDALPQAIVNLVPAVEYDDGPPTRAIRGA